MTPKTYSRPSDDEIKKKLTPIQYHVTQKHGTEPPFQNEFYKSKDVGLYVDIVSGEPLFSSKDKFDSGTGWPSFTQPIVSKNIVEVVDTSHGMRRVEVRSKYADSHLGHVFNDGPKPTGMRYCINSAALRFIPADKLDAEGYGEFKASVGAVSDAKAGDIACPVPGKAGLGLPPGCEATMEVAILAGGCFWGMEDIIRKVPGVIDTDVGYTGGTTEKPTYNDIKTGRTGHAEALKVVFDPKKISYAELLEKWFFKMHDPTTKNRQGNDIGTQYRSAIFYVSEAQKKTAEEVKEKVDQSGKWKRPIVTEIVAASDFTVAEGYHQDYLVKNPNGYTCHFMRE